MKKGRKFKNKWALWIGYFSLFIFGIGIFGVSILKIDSLKETKDYEFQQAQEILKTEEETTLYVPDIKEKILEYQKTESQKKQIQDKKEENGIKDFSLLEEKESSLEEMSTTPLIIPEEKPTIITNGEENSFISNGRIDENGNVISTLQSEKNQEVNKKETYSSQDKIEESIDSSEILEPDSKEFDVESFWKNSGNKVVSETADFELTGKHTGY
ncbi:MAG: hypothetical protein HFI05_06050 [Lachnospiraceae bacterium]|nr:hypothetical protein [Lachnospiraceae bacterium]